MRVETHGGTGMGVKMPIEKISQPDSPNGTTARAEANSSFRIFPDIVFLFPVRVKGLAAAPACRRLRSLSGISDPGL
jgi:hypothetical protein